jgi:hypothetical protein
MLVCENSWIIEMHGATIKVLVYLFTFICSFIYIYLFLFSHLITRLFTFIYFLFTQSIIYFHLAIHSIYLHTCAQIPFAERHYRYAYYRTARNNKTSA